jgi:hypothetical protein
MNSFWKTTRQDVIRCRGSKILVIAGGKSHRVTRVDDTELLDSVEAKTQSYSTLR